MDILEGKVFEMIRETMLDPARLRVCIEGQGGLDDLAANRALDGDLDWLSREKASLVSALRSPQARGLC
jgi:hypothetical protein